MKRLRPFRDKLGSFAKRPSVKRDEFGRFAKRRPAKRRPARRQPAKPSKKQRKTKQEKPYKYKLQEPKYNLCFPADRQAFYDDIIAARKQAGRKLSEEQISALRVEIDIVGTPKPRKTKSGRKSRRKTTAFIGRRRFSDLRRLKRFLLLDSGQHSGKSNVNPFGVDWRKKALCQYPKSAKLFVKPETKRQREKIIKKFALGD